MSSNPATYAKATSTDLERFGNKFHVVKNGDGVWFPQAIPQGMNKHEAMLLAAWIVRLMDSKGGEEFSELLRQVRGMSS